MSCEEDEQQVLRCGNCGQFAGVTYEWRGASYTEVIDCGNCGRAGYKYDPWVAAIEEMDDEEVEELVA